MNKTAKVQDINTSKEVSDLTGINWAYVLQGTLTVLAVMAMVGFWGTFAYSMITGNVKVAMAFGQIISIMVGVVVPILIIKKLHEHINKN